MHCAALVLGEEAGSEMIAKHTLTHAIQYLRDALAERHRSFFPGTEAEEFARADPGKPCAAYGLAKRTLKRCGSLDAAIVDLKKQLEAV